MWIPCWMILLLKLFASLKCFTSQEEHLRHTFIIYHYRLWIYEYECVSLEGLSLLLRHKSRTLGLIEHRVALRMHNHILPSVRICLYTYKALAGDACSEFLSLPTSLFSDFIWVLLFTRDTYWLPSSVRRYERKYSVLRDSRWRNLEFFTPHLWFNCRSVDWLLFQKENRWLCHSVCTNCWVCLLYAVSGKW